MNSIGSNKVNKSYHYTIIFTYYLAYIHTYYLNDFIQLKLQSLISHNTSMIIKE